MVDLRKRGQGRYLALAAVSALCSCAAPTPYVPPDGGPVARLLVRSNALMAGTATLATFDGAQDCSGPRSLASTASGKMELATAIRANQPLSLRIHQAVNLKVCDYIVTFDVKAAHKYLVTPFSDPERCGMAVHDVTSGDHIPEPSARKRQLTDYMKGGFCASQVATPVLREEAKPSLSDLRDLLPGIEKK